MFSGLKQTNNKSLVEFHQVQFKSRKSFNLQREADKVEQWKAVNRARNRWVISILRLVKSAFKDELRTLIDSASNALTPQGLVDSVLEDVRLNHEAWKATIKNIYVPVARSLAFDVIDSLKHDAPTERKALTAEEELIIDPLILDYIDGQSGKKVVGILDTTLVLLRDELERGVILGEGIEQLAKRIDTLYLEKLMAGRSKTIARTEVIQASNFGSFIGAKSTGIQNLKKVWLSTRDGRLRTTHDIIDGDKVGIDAAFVLASGSRLMFPADSSLGAAAGDVINCRCTQFFEGEG